MLKPIASQAIEELLFQATTQGIQGTTSIRPINVRRMSAIMVGVEAAQFYSDHLYNGIHFENWVDHVREMAR